MVLPQAFLLGDVARLRFSALEENASSTKTKAGTEEDGHNLHGEPAAFEKGIGYILDRSFGKVTAVEVIPPSLEPVAPPSLPPSSKQPTVPLATGLRCLQLSLEEVFYLTHIDECLELVLANIPAAAPAALLPHKEHPLEEEENPDFFQSRGNDDVSFVWNEKGLGMHADGCIDRSEPLSREQAWRYCCGRRPDFPAMFAVYRHFRARSYTVHPGHKYGAHFVLYEGPPDECHSRYCVHVMGTTGSSGAGGAGVGGGDSWGHVKTVTRLMPDVAKCLLVCGVSYGDNKPTASSVSTLLSSSSSPSSPPSPHLSPSLPMVDTSSLAALDLAEVKALTFARSTEERGGCSNRGGVPAAASSTTAVLKPGTAGSLPAYSGRSRSKGKRRRGAGGGGGGAEGCAGEGVVQRAGGSEGGTA